MISLTYCTIREPVRDCIKKKESKFIAFAYPVQSETDIKQKIEMIKKEYFDARHHCFAWTLGADKKHFRAFDDGEPNHSAGDPILGQIRSKGLTDILIVVVRYFGGTKLGVGGLISAYKAAAEDTLDNAVIIERDVIEVLRLTYPYTSTPEVMRMVKEFDLHILQQQFDKDCMMSLEMKLKNKKAIVERIELLKATGHIMTMVII